jgi:hypothetical protein
MGNEDFISYVLSFYNGEDGIYKDVDATPAEVVAATRKLEKMYRSHGEEPVYDSIDRERVRDFILEGRKKCLILFLMQCKMKLNFCEKWQRLRKRKTSLFS